MAFIKKTEKLLKIGLKRGKIFVVAVSEENCKLMLQYFNGASDKISYINNGVSLSSYRKREHDFFTFINVARQDENKNQSLIIDCFERVHKRYPQTRLLLVGDGPTHQALKDQVVGLNLEDSVELPGNVSNVEDYYAVSDVYLQSSHREAMPMSVLEAMATRLPIVSTDVGGMKDVVSNNGVLITDNDTEGFEQAMFRIFEIDETERKKLGENSYSIVQKYSSETMTEEYVRLYEEIKEYV
jgi:glycosyltransferase involved in cell wall biosynthesis